MILDILRYRIWICVVPETQIAGLKVGLVFSCRCSSELKTFCLWDCVKWLTISSCCLCHHEPPPSPWWISRSSSFPLSCQQFSGRTPSLNPLPRAPLRPVLLLCLWEWQQQLWSTQPFPFHMHLQKGPSSLIAPVPLPFLAFCFCLGYFCRCFCLICPLWLLTCMSQLERPCYSKVIKVFIHVFS